MSAKPHKYDPYADLLLEILNPNAPTFVSAMNRRTIQRYINDRAATLGEKPPSAASIVNHIRKELGGHVLVYDRRSDLYVVADNAEIAHWYVNKRRDLALSHARNAKKIVEDLIAQFPAYAPSMGPVFSALSGAVSGIEAHKSMTPDIVTSPVAAAATTTAAV